jgi:hypothetical protein
VVRREALVAGLMVVGVGLRVWQYLADTSMWFDELSVARNVSERSLGELLRQPLAYEQTAPLGFLAAVKLSTMLLGSSDLALRLFPFLCGIAGADARGAGPARASTHSSPMPGGRHDRVRPRVVLAGGGAGSCRTRRRARTALGP